MTAEEMAERLVTLGSPSQGEVGWTVYVCGLIAWTHSNEEDAERDLAEQRRRFLGALRPLLAEVLMPRLPGHSMTPERLAQIRHDRPRVGRPGTESYRVGCDLAEVLAYVAALEAEVRLMRQDNPDFTSGLEQGRREALALLERAAGILDREASAAEDEETSAFVAWLRRLATEIRALPEGRP